MKLRVRIAVLWRRRSVRMATAAAAVPLVALAVTTGYYYVLFARHIDVRLHGERERVLPRVLARPLELRRGQGLTQQQLVDRLNDLGYAERARLERPGEFKTESGAITIAPRGREFGGRPVRVLFQR